MTAQMLLVTRILSLSWGSREGAQVELDHMLPSPLSYPPGAQRLVDSLDKARVSLAEKCQCASRDVDPLAPPPASSSYPAPCLPGWCYTTGSSLSKINLWSLDGEYILKFQVPRRQEDGQCGDVDFKHLIMENEGIRFMRSVGDAKDTVWRNVAWHSELFEVGINTAECADKAPAFLSSRFYGRLARTHRLDDLDYIWREAFFLSHSFEGELQKHLPSLIGSLLRLESFVEKHSLVMDDVQFIVTTEGVALFDTMVAKMQCSDAKAAQNATELCSLPVQYLRSFLLHSAFGLLIHKHLPVQQRGWADQVRKAARDFQQTCEYGGILTGFPAVIPRDVLRNLRENSPLSKQVLGRLSTLFKEYAQIPGMLGDPPPSGFTCLSSFPDHPHHGHLKCGASGSIGTIDGIFYGPKIHLPLVLQTAIEQYPSWCSAFTLPISQ
jgi:hypothetical protein